MPEPGHSGPGRHPGPGNHPDGTQLSALADALDGALRSLGDGPVDTSSLVSGAQTRARRIRTRRLSAAALAVAVVAGIPLGYELLRPEATYSPPSAVLVSPGARHIPDSVGLHPADITGATLVQDTGQTVHVGPLPGATCARPDAGRAWTWRQASGAEIRLVVTVWQSRATTLFDAVTGGTGACHWADQPRPVSTAGWAAGDQRWLATSPGTSLGLVRVGDVLVGVQIKDGAATSPPTAVVAETRRLAQIVAQRVRAAHLT